MLESWTTISVLAGITSKIRLGTMMTGIIYRHPSILAKIGATLDVLSKGRLFMGIGAAWNEEESLAYGIPFPSIKGRFVRLEEAIQIVRKMWTDEPSSSFDGKYYQIKNAMHVTYLDLLHRGIELALKFLVLDFFNCLGKLYDEKEK
jgi:alkanesulfonate monooxygenase SsuD/methylene tetrahydromethanopterin reductase-like flavin-dependent oxidoreductase (luciferase family)